jgi:hypothetical protein
MKFTRRGKCADCGEPCRQQKEILITVDMFDPNPKTYLKGPVLQELRAWRKQKLFCGGDACIASTSQLQLRDNHSSGRSE